VDGVEREMAINNAKLVGKSVYQTLEQGGEPCTAWSLEVAVFDQHQSSVSSSPGPLIWLNLGDLPGSGRRGYSPTGGRLPRRCWGVFRRRSGRRFHSGCRRRLRRCGFGRRRLASDKSENQPEANKYRERVFHGHQLSRNYVFLKTRTSPTRLVTRRSSRCSMRARAYLRLAPNMSRTWATEMSPSRRM